MIVEWHLNPNLNPYFAVSPDKGTCSGSVPRLEGQGFTADVIRFRLQLVTKATCRASKRASLLCPGIINLFSHILYPSHSFFHLPYGSPGPHRLVSYSWRYHVALFGAARSRNRSPVTDSFKLRFGRPTKCRNQRRSLLQTEPTQEILLIQTFPRQWLRRYPRPTVGAAHRVKDRRGQVFRGKEETEGQGGC